MDVFDLKPNSIQADIVTYDLGKELTEEQYIKGIGEAYKAETEHFVASIKRCDLLIMKAWGDVPTIKGMKKVCVKPKSSNMFSPQYYVVMMSPDIYEKSGCTKTTSRGVLEDYSTYIRNLCREQFYSVSKEFPGSTVIRRLNAKEYMQASEVVQTCTLRVVHASEAYRNPSMMYRMVLDYPYLLVEEGLLKREQNVKEANMR